MASELTDKNFKEYQELEARFTANGNNLCRKDLTRFEALLKDATLGIDSGTIRRFERRIRPCFERNNTYEDLLSLFQEASLHMERAQLEDLANLHKQLYPTGDEATWAEIDNALNEMRAEKGDDEGKKGKGKAKKDRKAKRASSGSLLD
jgi:hypothetical protein